MVEWKRLLLSMIPRSPSWSNAMHLAPHAPGLMPFDPVAMQPTLLLMIQGWCPSCSNAMHLAPHDPGLMPFLLQCNPPCSSWSMSYSAWSGTMHPTLLLIMIQDWRPFFSKHPTFQLSTIQDFFVPFLLHNNIAEQLLYSVLCQLSCPVASKCIIYFKQNQQVTICCKLFNITIRLPVVYCFRFWKLTSPKSRMACAVHDSIPATLNSQSYNDWLVVLHKWH